MRLKYKELKGRLYERERQFELARKNMKYTSMQELELELESYRAETVRLRKQIEELQRLNQKFLSDNRLGIRLSLGLSMQMAYLSRFRKRSCKTSLRITSRCTHTSRNYRRCCRATGYTYLHQCEATYGNALP
jgi:hypothetical protein